MSERSKRPKSFLAGSVDPEEWQLGEVRAGMDELDRGQEVSDEKVAKWLNSWGKRSETKAPRGAPLEMPRASQSGDRARWSGGSVR